MEPEKVLLYINSTLYFLGLGTYFQQLHFRTMQIPSTRPFARRQKRLQPLEVADLHLTMGANYELVGGDLAK